MAVPRNRHSNARKNSKRAHFAQKRNCYVICPDCGKSKLPHKICSTCGMYKGVLYKTQEVASE